MRVRSLAASIASMAAFLPANTLIAQTIVAQPQLAWAVHDTSRPLPPSVTPASQNLSVAPPSDAVVLFDGKSASQWQRADGAPAPWRVHGGHLEIVPGSGDIQSRRAFGDVQLHVEWMAPDAESDTTYYRGNSGVYLMGLYEVQILDSYRNGVKIYADGQAASLYGQYPPLVNASLPPRTWQTFDIVFRRPRFGTDGGLQTPARVTVFHNGVLAQHDVALTGPTAHKARPPYVAHADRLPIVLQAHGSPVRFRNMWVRELAESAR
ncbi:MAG: DUF1080 domain-containing protein [Gemmatimonadaceae bacterium]